MPRPRYTPEAVAGRARPRRRTAAHAAAVGLLVGGALVAASPAQAVTFTVTSTGDAVDTTPGDGDCTTALPGGACTLRAAVQEANAQGGAHTVQLPAGAVALTIPVAGEDAAASGDLDVAAGVALTLTGGSVTSGPGSRRPRVPRARGRVADRHRPRRRRVHRRRCAERHRWRQRRRVPRSPAPSTSPAGRSAGNEAERAGGAIEASAGQHDHARRRRPHRQRDRPHPGQRRRPAPDRRRLRRITDLDVTANTAAAEGGGLWNGVGTMTVTASTVSGNTASGALADDGGGGLFNSGGTAGPSTAARSPTTSADGAAGSGGGLFSPAAPSRSSGTTVTGNTAVRAGGGVEALGTPDGHRPPDAARPERQRDRRRAGQRWRPAPHRCRHRRGRRQRRHRQHRDPRGRRAVELGGRHHDRHREPGLGQHRERCGRRQRRRRPVQRRRHPGRRRQRGLRQRRGRRSGLGRRRAQPRARCT